MQRSIKNILLLLGTLILSVFVCFFAFIFFILSILIIIAILPFISFKVTYRHLKTNLNRYIYNKRKIKWMKKNVLMWKAVSVTNCEDYVYEYSYLSNGIIVQPKKKMNWNKPCKYIQQIVNEKISHQMFFQAHKLAIRKKIMFSYITPKRTKEY